MLGNGARYPGQSDESYEKMEDAWRKRGEYLALPYDHPLRRMMRDLEARLGLANREEHERNEAKGIFSELLTEILTAAGAIGGYIILGPYGVVPGAMAGAAAGVILSSDVRVRFLYPGEYRYFDEEIFRGTLPPRNRILVTDVVGLGGRPFVTPGSELAALSLPFAPALRLLFSRNLHNFSSYSIMNLGQAPFERPLHYKPLLAHELTHVWQIKHGFVPYVICEGVWNQTRYNLGDKSVYDAQPGKQWREYNLEQQGELVEAWSRAAQGLDQLNHPNYRYISGNIRKGDPRADTVDRSRVGKLLEPKRTLLKRA